MSDVIKVEFTIESGLRKVDKLRLIASEIDNQYARMKDNFSVNNTIPRPTTVQVHTQSSKISPDCPGSLTSYRSFHNDQNIGAVAKPL